jgi:hypothetical protein
MARTMSPEVEHHRLAAYILQRKRPATQPRRAEQRRQRTTSGA